MGISALDMSLDKQCSKVAMPQGCQAQASGEQPDASSKQVWSIMLLLLCANAGVLISTGSCRYPLIGYLCWN